MDDGEYPALLTNRLELALFCYYFCGGVLPLIYISLSQSSDVLNRKKKKEKKEFFLLWLGFENYPLAP